MDVSTLLVHGWESTLGKMIQDQQCSLMQTGLSVLSVSTEGVKIVPVSTFYDLSTPSDRALRRILSRGKSCDRLGLRQVRDRLPSQYRHHHSHSWVRTRLPDIPLQVIKVAGRFRMRGQSPRVERLLWKSARTQVSAISS